MLTSQATVREGVRWPVRNSIMAKEPALLQMWVDCLLDGGDERRHWRDRCRVGATIERHGSFVWRRIADVISIH